MSAFASLSLDKESDSEPETTMEPKPSQDTRVFSIVAPIPSVVSAEEDTDFQEVKSHKRTHRNGNKKMGHRGHRRANDRNAFEKERIANVEAYDKELARRYESHKHAFEKRTVKIGKRTVDYHTQNPDPKNRSKVTLIHLLENEQAVRDVLIRGFETVESEVGTKEDGTPTIYKYYQVVYTTSDGAVMTAPTSLQPKLYYYHPDIGHHGVVGIIYNAKFVTAENVVKATNEIIAIIEAIMADNKSEPSDEHETTESPPQPQPKQAQALKTEAESWLNYKPANGGQLWGDIAMEYS